MKRYSYSIEQVRTVIIFNIVGVNIDLDLAVGQSEKIIIQSKNAKGLSIVFDNLSLKGDEELLIYHDRNIGQLRYSKKNINQDKKLVTPEIFAESVTVE